VTTQKVLQRLPPPARRHTTSTAAGVADGNGRRRFRLGILLALVTTLIVAGVVGAVLDLRLAHTRSERAALGALADPATPGLRPGQPIRTSFGAMTVDAATLDNGLSSEDLGGMTHGVSGLVSQGYAEVTVQVTVNNTAHHPVIVQATQFRMLRQPGASKRVSVAASATTLQAGPLPGRSSIDLRLTFVTPTDGSRLWLQYADPGHPTLVLVDLGSTAKITAPVENHQH
jgi:hypothetical protein